ncbi:hypothetical protein [Marinobacter sp. P4B1]|uniref:hypothetical protein n=1 Tax=Marinobacter sp. P4B1 TaxID=1119533 RepID=UPI0011A1EB9D|nr:hypothetical protein [Marinobacter sp. P4B1]
MSLLISSLALVGGIDGGWRTLLYALALGSAFVLLRLTEYDGWVDRSGFVRESPEYITQELERMLDRVEESSQGIKPLSAEARQRFDEGIKRLGGLSVRANQAGLLSDKDFQKLNDRILALVNNDRL